MVAVETTWNSSRRISFITTCTCISDAVYVNLMLFPISTASLILHMWCIETKLDNWLINLIKTMSMWLDVGVKMCRLFLSKWQLSRPYWIANGFEVRLGPTTPCIVKKSINVYQRNVSYWKHRTCFMFGN